VALVTEGENDSGTCDRSVKVVPLVCLGIQGISKLGSSGYDYLSLVNTHRRCGGASCLNLQGLSSARTVNKSGNGHTRNLANNQREGGGGGNGHGQYEL
jgi:hypothetical protein